MYRPNKIALQFCSIETSENLRYAGRHAHKNDPTLALIWNLIIKKWPAAIKFPIFYSFLRK